MRSLLLVLLLLPGFAFGARSGSFVSSRDTVSLISAANDAPGGAVTLALQFRLAPGWHIYWSNPGDAGLTPQVVLGAPAAAAAIDFPPPEFLLQDGVAAYVLSGDVVLPFRAIGVGAAVTAQARWLVCRDICVPEHAAFSLPLPGGVSAEAALFPQAAIVASPFAARVAPDGTLRLAGATRTQISAARFFPSQPGAIVNAAPQPLAFDAAGMTLRLTPGPAFAAGAPLAGVLELTDPSGATQALSIDAMPGLAVTAASVRPPLVLWLGFAFLGGVLLNLMPCVFPVLAMKAFGLIRLSNAARAAVRREALGYTAGVLAAMLALAVALLAVRAGGGAAGWGFQFQSPVFVAVLAWLVFCAGLSLAGMFTLPARIGGLALPQGSFFNGLLAVAVATPCTAPFMAGAVAAALAAPAARGAGDFSLHGAGAGRAVSAAGGGAGASAFSAAARRLDVAGATIAEPADVRDRALAGLGDGARGGHGGRAFAPAGRVVPGRGVVSAPAAPAGPGGAAALGAAAAGGRRRGADSARRSALYAGAAGLAAPVGAARAGGRNRGLVHHLPGQ